MRVSQTVRKNRPNLGRLATATAIQLRSSELPGPVFGVLAGARSWDLCIDRHHGIDRNGGVYSGSATGAVPR